LEDIKKRGESCKKLKRKYCGMKEEAGDILPIENNAR
jgi:hypothetical protein